MSSQRVVQKMGPWILGILFVFSLLVPAALAGTTVETVDSAEMVGQYTSLTVDGAGKVHISYYDGINYDLKYATNASDAWNITAPDTGGDVGQYTSLAVDGADKVHISYYDVTNADLKYATNASGSWVTTTLDSTGLVGSYTSLAVDSNGKVHISYYDLTNANLKYATNVTGSWVTATLDSTGNVGSYTSLSVDGTNKVHISFYDSTLACLKYATNVSGSWTAELVANSGGSAGQYTSLAVDGSGKVHIGYFDYLNHDLKYTTNRSGTWQATILDSTGNVGSYGSLKVDNLGRIHISYMDSTNLDLKYATNVSGNWLLTTVDAAGYVGPHTSLALDGSGNVHIGYFDSTNGDLKYARITGDRDAFSQLVWSEVGAVALPGWTEQLTVAANTLYVANYDRGVKLFDLTNPALPVASGDIATTPSFAEALAVQGTMAYVAQVTGSLATLNVAVPATITKLGSIDLADSPSGVAIAGAYAYVADNEGGLRVIDVSNPAAPVLAASLAMPFAVNEARAIKLAHAGTFVYIAAGFSGLQIVDVSDPTQPVIIGSWQASGKRFLDVAVAGNYAYLADWYGGVQIFDISNPATPIARGYFDTPPESHGIAVADSVVFLANGQSGLFVIDVSNPAAPQGIAMIDTPGYALDADIVGTTVYVADQTGGVRIVQGTVGTSPADDDADGLANSTDNCPAVANADQANYDGDGLGDACDPDDDNDGILDGTDQFPLNQAEWADSDGDGIGDNADGDQDSDGLPNIDELSLGLDPLNSADGSFDLDADGYTNLREYLSGSLLNNPANRLIWSGIGNESKLLPSEAIFASSFGSAVAGYGDILAVADGYQSTPETLSIFRNQSGTWVRQQRLEAADGLAYDGIPEGLAMEAMTIVGGARWNDEAGNNAGAVVVFGYNGSSWSEQAKIKPADIAAEDRFGWSVAISGDRLVASSNYDDDKGENSGSVYVFRRSGNSWVQEAKLTASDGAAYDYFGQAVAIEGDQIFVGASFDGDLGPASGSVYIFRNDDNGWQQVQKIHANDGAASDFFGCRLSVSGNRLAVGAFADDDRGNNAGAVYFFTYNGSAWGQVTKLTASDGVADDSFGNMLDLRNDTLLVGVSRDSNEKGNYAGGAYLFSYVQGSWVEHKLVASDGKADSNYGQYVVLADGYAIIGASNDDNKAINSGAVYIYPLSYDLFADADADSIPDTSDNCPAIANPDQANFDGDTLGDLCDPDDDNDGIPDLSEIANGTDPLNADTTPPVVSFASSRTGLTNQSSTILTYSANEPATFSISRNAAAVTIASGGTLALLEGTNSITVTATDAAGNKATSTLAVSRDSIAPVTTASIPGGNYTTAKSIVLTSSESATIYYTLNGDTPTPAASVYSSPLNIAVSTTLKYFACDPAGNSEAVKTQIYAVTLPPVSTIPPPALGSSFNVLNGLTGGAIVFDWPTYDPGAITVTAYQLYYSNRPFTNISGMTPLQSYLPPATTGGLTGLVDNVPVYVALVPVGSNNQIDTNVAPVAVTPTRQGVSGIVKDWVKEFPLNGIKVSAGSYSITTASDGSFKLTGLPIGSNTLTVGEEGGDLRFNSTTKAVTVTAGQMTNTTVYLFNKTHNLEPSTPANFTATAGDNKVTLHWDPNTDADLAGYYVYRDDVALNATPLMETFYIDQTVSNGATYTYTIKSYSQGNLYSPATSPLIVTPIAITKPPVDLNASLNCDGTVTLSWLAPASSDLDGYNVYQQTGSTMSYGGYEYLLGDATTWTSEPLDAGQTYTFALRSVGTAGEETNTTVKTTVFVPSVWNTPQAVVSIPKAGKRIDGNTLHIQAEPATPGCGTATTTSVRFQYRPSDTSTWMDIPAALPQHPNPATNAPFFTKWDVTRLSEGNYDLRSIAANTISTGYDAGFITITIDHHQPQLAENRSADNTPTAQGMVEKNSANAVTTGLVSTLFPAGSLASDAVLNISTLPPEEQPSGSSSLLATPVNLTLSSGQTTFLNGSEVEIALGYSDRDNNNIIDGQGTFAQDTEAATFNPTSGLWEPLTGTTLDTTQKQVKGMTVHFSTFGLSRKPGLPQAPKSAGISAPLTNTSGTYQVSWSFPSGTGNLYELQQATDSNFTQNLTTLYTGTSNYFNLNNQPKGSYYYRVRSARLGHQPSAWQAVAYGVTVDLACGKITGINAPATNTTGSYQISWSVNSTPGVTYNLYENGNSTPIYSGTNNYCNVSNKANGTYSYAVQATKNGYKDSAVRGPVTTTVILTVGNIRNISAPATNTTGSYQVSWSVNSTPGVTYILKENDITLYTGANNYFNVSGRTTASYSYTVQAIKTGHVDSSVKGPAIVAVSR